MSNYDYDVFISYSDDDAVWVQKELLGRLEACGLRVCINVRDFVPGRPIIEEIQRALSTSCKTVLVLTPSYLKSGWKTFERLMLQTLERESAADRLIPICKMPCDVPLSISYLVTINFVNPRIWSEEWHKLLSALATRPIDDKAITPEDDISRQEIITYAKNVRTFALTYSESMWQGKYIYLEGAIASTLTFARPIVTSITNTNGINHPLSTEKSIFDFIDEHKKLLILGHAGAGKTTVFLEILRRLTEKVIDSEVLYPIPIYVPLSRLSSQVDVYRLVQMSLSKHKLVCSSDTFTEMLVKGYFCILFDGLNEVPASIRRDVGLGIINFMDLYPENRFYLTSRPYDFDSQIKNQMPIVSVQPLKKEGVLHFVRNHLEEANAEAFLENSGLYDDTNWRNLDSPIHILRNPLLLFMSVQIFVQTGKIHLFRGEIFASFFDMILRRERDLARPNKFDPSVKREFLTDLSFEMLERGYILSANEEDVISIFSNTDWKSSNKDERDYLGSLIDEVSMNGFLRSDILSEYSIKKIEWFHQRYQEYFAARKVVALYEAGKSIRTYLNDPNWKQVIILAASITRKSEDFVSHVIFGWKGILEFVEHRNHRIVLVTDILLINKSLYREDFRNNILSRTNKTMGREIPRKTIFLLEAIVGVLGFISKYIGHMLLNAEAWERTLAVGIWLIGISKDEQQYKILLTYLDDPRNRIRWMTAYALERLGSCLSVDALINSLSEPDKDVRWRIIRALATIKDKKAVPPLIIFLGHEDAYTRAGAAYALADMKAKEALYELKRSAKDPLNQEMLGWGETVAEVMEKAILVIEKDLDWKEVGRPPWIY